MDPATEYNYCFTHGPSNRVELLFYTWTKQLSRITVLHMDQATEYNYCFTHGPSN